VIRFSAFLVAVALGLLVAGVVTSKLTLVYVAIGVSGVALLALGVGAVLKRNELFGQPKSAEPEPVRAEPAAAAYLPPAQPQPQVAPWEAAVPAASAWPAAAQSAPSRAGYLPSDQPLRPQPIPARPPVQAPPVQAPPVNVRPAERPADAPRRSAAFTPRPPTAPPDELPAEDDVAAQDQRPQQQEPPAESQPSAQDQHETRDQPPDERPAADQKTQQLPVFASAASEPAPDAAPLSATEPAPAIVDLQREVTVVPGVPRYHDPQCLLIRFMGENDLDKMTLGAAREAGCTPCRACLPDQPEANPD
jgi:hypothetical protein